jgi:hypothetical protein
MTQETFTALAAALENAKFYSLFADVAGVPAEDFEDTKKFGLSFNVETNELQFIKYITNEDKSWVGAYEQQNPCIIVGYVGANDIISGDPANDIIEAYQNEYPELQIN